MKSAPACGHDNGCAESSALKCLKTRGRRATDGNGDRAAAFTRASQRIDGPLAIYMESSREGAVHCRPWSRPLLADDFGGDAKRAAESSSRDGDHFATGDDAAGDHDADRIADLLVGH